MIFVSSSKTILKLGAFTGRLYRSAKALLAGHSEAGAGWPSKKLVLLDSIDFILKMMMVIRNGMKALDRMQYSIMEVYST